MSVWSDTSVTFPRVTFIEKAFQAGLLISSFIALSFWDISMVFFIDSSLVGGGAVVSSPFLFSNGATAP